MTSTASGTATTGARPRLLHLFVLVGLVFTALPLLPAGASGACPPPHAQRAGEWTVVDAPGFASGGAELTSAAVAFEGRRVTVTNGARVVTASNDTCAWREVWPADHSNPLTDEIAPRPGETVATVVASQSRSAQNTIWVLLRSAGAGATNLRVLTSRDAGQTWKASQTPLVAAEGATTGGRCGYPNSCRLVNPASNVERLYLTFATPEGSTALFVSNDAGATFANRTDASLIAGVTGGFADFEVHPTRSDFAIGTTRQGQIIVTEDGGQTFASLNQTPGAPIGAFAIGDEPGVPDHYTALTLDNGFNDASIGRRWATTDGGQVWNESFAANIGLAGSLNSAAFAPNRDVYVVTLATGSALIEGPDSGRFFSITAPGRVPLRDVQQVRGLGLSFVSPGAVVLYAPSGPPTPPPPPPLDVDTFFPAPPPPPPAATLTPPTLQLDIPLGESRTVELGLELPARPTPIDVFFLLDTSSSQEPAINGLKAGAALIARELAEAGLDVNFGLGEYQDSGAKQGSGVRYRRRVDVQRPSQTLLRELDAMRTRGGTEPHLTALHQVATGSGIANPSVGAPVPAGQQANWRPGSVRVVLMTADNEVMDGEEQGFGPDPDGPSMAQTLAALNGRDIKFVGIELRKREDGQTTVGGLLGIEDITNPNVKSKRRVLMDQVAAGTGARAPVGGVDCDGDGTRELDTDEPLVCAVPWDPDSGSVGDVVEMADPIVRLLLSFADQRPAQLVAVETSGMPVTTTARADYSDVDVRFDNRLFFAASFTCTDQVAGTNHPIRLEARLAAETVATTSGNVQCGKLEPPPRADPRAPAPPAAQPAPAPPAPVTVTSVTTAPAAASAPAVASVGSPVGVVTDQDSPQHQVSTAGSGRGQGMLLASVPVPRREPLPVVTWVGASALSLAFGGYAAQRERRRRAEVHSR